ncbi:hypothetical protein QU661_07685 [Mogibacterium neglectum]|uniref:hypothetical protein n=1 Tax=Mogibacterium neglectum TaxID=114528 RepID=UPI00272AEEA2|nr:hypothetical protein [Mogibacterium neglectum]WLD76149.1 hypothetical protein QU661_07685 [Mogibacterium neglectum]
MKKIKWVKKIERISDAGDIKESMSIKIHKDGTALKTNYDTFEKATAAAERMMN